MSRLLIGAVTLIGGVYAAVAAVNVAATNNLPNPYHPVENWAQLPAGVQWGQVIGVQPDAHGNLWVFHRSDPAILEFDASGKYLKGFANGMFAQAHGLSIDRDGNIWVTDAEKKDGKGMQVFKFSPDGKILMTLGKAGVAGAGPDTFNGPSSVVVAPNGDIFVADGHGEGTNARVVKFSKDGKFIKEWGKKGSGPGEFDTLHSMAMDSKGRLFIADRGNSRIQIFDQDGNFIDQWKQFGRPSGIFISKNDTLYSVDSQSDEKTNPGVKRGIRIGSAKDGSVKVFIPDTSTDPKIALAEGVSADAKGDTVYAAGVSSMGLHKFVKQ
ncbi:MAG: peptidyl-alpha-hydroxyglycine alpha-amidating lyase family protein [Bryobacteraceae bacterium]